jgi:uncharacterized protein (TIGR03437 family)
VAKHSTAKCKPGGLLFLAVLWPVTAFPATNTVVTLSATGNQQLGQPLMLAAQVTPTSPSWPTGTVEFSAGGAPIAGCSGVKLEVWMPGALAVAQCVTSFSQLGTVGVTARYGGDANTSTSTGTLQLTIGKVYGEPYIASNPVVPPSTALPYGQAVILGARFVPAPGVPPPTGTVTFRDSGATLTTTPIGADGHAGWVVPAFSVGTHSIAASYGGDANYQPSETPVLTISVIPAAVLVTVTSTAFQPGQPVTLYATPVVASPGNAIPSGTVSFSSATGIISGCGNLALEGGMARCATIFPQAGTVLVSYSGDAHTAALPPTPYQLIVGKALAGISLLAASTSTVLGATVTIDAQVLRVPDLAGPTGTVAFSDNGTALATAPVGAGGRVTLVAPSKSLAALSIGVHMIKGVYSGDATYQSATANLPVNVAKAPTMITVAATAAQVGSSATFSAVVSAVSPASVVPTGTVDFSYGDGSRAAGCTLAPVNGVAQCSAAVSALASYTVNAAYGGDANAAGSASAVQLIAGKPLLGIYTLANFVTPPFGTPVTVTAVLSGAAGGPAAGGTVTFSDGAAELATAPLAGGRVSATLSSLSVGNHEIVAVYSGDGNYPYSTAPALTVVVNRAVTVLDLASTPAQAGQPLTITAAVTVLGPGSAAQGGTVDFSIGSVAIPGCVAMPLQNGLAQCATLFPATGAYTINSSYSGGENTVPASASMQLSVGKAVPGFFVATYAAALPYGAGVGINALLMGTPMPTGNVTFADGGSTLATIAVSGGAASLVIPSGLLAPLSVGSHSITASYSGDAGYQPAAAAALNLSISKAATVLAVAATPAQIDQPVTLKAAVTVVSPGSATPTGTVDISSGGLPIAGCSGLVPQAGTVFCSAVFQQTGAYTITARYNGDAHTAVSTGTLTLNTGRAVAGIYTASTPAAAVFGTPVTVSALLLGANGVAPPTGTVTFYNAGAVAGVSPVDGDGRASVSLAPGALAAGPHTFTAGYSGDPNYAAGSAPALTVTVAKANTSTALAATFNTPFSATVSVAAPGAGIPTGSVQFFAGGALVGTAPLVQRNGVSSAGIAAGPWAGSIRAVYQGDVNFGGSNSAAFNVAASATLSITGDPNPSVIGQAITYSVKLTPASGSIIPSGRVQLSADGVALGSTTLASGQASFTAAASLLPFGSHTITANYAGDGVYPAAAATLVQVVTKTIAALTLSSSLATSVYGQPVTLTAHLSGAGAAASGTVQFLDGTTPAGSATLSSGIASVTLATLPAGPHSLSATWAGDGNASAASAAPLPLVVNRARTATYLSSTGVSLAVTVSAVAPGAGTPTGNVTWLDASTNAIFSMAVLAGGTAVTAQPATSDAVMAAYSGDANFEAGFSAVLSPLAVVNAASFTAGGFAPDEIVTLFGSNLSTGTLSAASNPLPSLGGTGAAVTDSAGVRRLALLFFVSKSQVNLVLPSGMASGPASVVVTNAAQNSFATGITVTPVAPGLFTTDGSGAGTPAGQIVRAHADGSQEAPQDITAAPIDLGAPSDTVFLVLYGTGIRHQTTATAMFVCPGCAAGAFPVAFAGAQPSLAGLDQVNVAVPPALRGAGPVSLTVVADNATSNTVTLNFR